MCSHFATLAVADRASTTILVWIPPLQGIAYVGFQDVRSDFIWHIAHKALGTMLHLGCAIKSIGKGSCDCMCRCR